MKKTISFVKCGYLKTSHIHQAVAGRSELYTQTASELMTNEQCLIITSLLRLSKKLRVKDETSCSSNIIVPVYC